MFICWTPSLSAGRKSKKTTTSKDKVISSTLHYPMMQLASLPTMQYSDILRELDVFDGFKSFRRPAS